MTEPLELCGMCGQSECVCDEYPDGFWRKNVQYHDRNLPVGIAGRRSPCTGYDYWAKCPKCGADNISSETLGDWGWMSFNCGACGTFYTANFGGTDEMGFRNK